MSNNNLITELESNDSIPELITSDFIPEFTSNDDYIIYNNLLIGEPVYELIPLIYNISTNIVNNYETEDNYYDSDNSNNGEIYYRPRDNYIREMRNNKKSLYYCCKKCKKKGRFSCLYACRPNSGE